MEPSSVLWALLVIGGPVVLGGALLYGRVRNRRKRKDIAEARERAR